MDTRVDHNEQTATVNMTHECRILRLMHFAKVDGQRRAAEATGESALKTKKNKNSHTGNHTIHK